MTTMDATIVDQVISRYEIDDIIKIDSSIRFGCLIQTTNKSYTLRSIKFMSRTKHMLYESSFSDYLANNGFPAQRIIKTNNNTLVCKVEDTVYYLTEYYDGAFVPDSCNLLSDRQIQEAGRQLAQMHLLSSKYMGPKIQDLPYQSRKAINTLVRVLNEIDLLPTKNEFDLLAYEVANQKIRYIRNNPFELQEFLGLERIMNHGDYHAGNMVFDSQNKIVAILDFEFCTEMPRIWDIAWAITWISRIKPTEAFSGKLDLSKARMFFSAYHKIYALTDQEKKFLVEMLVSACYHSTYLLERHYLLKKIDENLALCTSEDEWLWLAGQPTSISKLVFD